MKKLDYIEVGSILYSDSHVNVKKLGYFGTKKMEYMKIEYVILMSKGTLFDYLEQIDIQATKKYDLETKSTKSNVMGTRNE